MRPEREGGGRGGAAAGWAPARPAAAASWPGPPLPYLAGVRGAGCCGRCAGAEGGGDRLGGGDLLGGLLGGGRFAAAFGLGPCCCCRGAAGFCGEGLAAGARCGRAGRGRRLLRFFFAGVDLGPRLEGDALGGGCLVGTRSWRWVEEDADVAFDSCTSSSRFFTAVLVLCCSWPAGPANRSAAKQSAAMSRCMPAQLTRCRAHWTPRRLEQCSANGI